MTKRAIHPWFILKDELKYRNVTQKEFAKIIWKNLAEVNDILNWKRSITTDFALRISAFLWTSHQVWLWMQSHFDVVKIFMKKSKNYK